jgi:DNA-binding NarL/FixJ family response regulator
MDTASPPPPVRVVLADMSRLTRELISRILEKEPGTHVVRDATAASVPLRRLVEETGAHVVIIGGDAADELAECRELLEERALLRMVVVSADGRDAHLHGIRAYETVVDDFSPRFVLDLVRPPENHDDLAAQRRSEP